MPEKTLVSRLHSRTATLAGDYLMTRLLPTFSLYLALLALASTAQAGRVVLFEIIVDGQVVLHVQKLDQGEAADIAWNYLKTVQLTNPAENYVVGEEQAAICKAFQERLAKTAVGDKVTIQGKCRIFCRYAGDIRVDELRLVRASAKAPWFLDPAQVDEMAKKRTIDKDLKARSQVDARP
jgi:hypothetical protein